jgi:NAD(P)-dependent dehydrogenase (short-subunit alcohol dehydrogenase family)
VNRSTGAVAPRSGRRVALVTGGSSGIGAAIVSRLVADGATAYSLDVRIPTDDVSRDRHVDCDVTSLESVAKAVGHIVEREGRVDVAVANAGVNLFGSVVETDLDAFERTVAVNVRGMFNTLKCVLPILQEQRSGSVVLMGSDQALVGKAKSAVYAATKGAAAQLAKSTAIDCAEYGVRVNCVCPGIIATPAFEAGLEEFAGDYLEGGSASRLRSAVVNRVPLRRVGRPEEVAALVAFLGSDEAGYITGAVISIDGGYVAQ